MLAACGCCCLAVLQLVSMANNFYTRLVYARGWPVFGRLAYTLLKALGAEIPNSVKVGKNFHLVHGGIGTVIHPNCVIGDDVTIYQGVTIGRGDTYRPAEQSRFKGITVADNVIVGPGAKILGTVGRLHVGAGTIVGANAVLQQSTNEGEVWAGVPARCIGTRDDPQFQ
jgi:serine O-acetyltransferase